MVDFNWKPLEFNSTHLSLKLDFTSPIEVSIRLDPNTLRIVVWNSSFFVRQKDLFRVPPESVFEKKLPRIIIEKYAESIVELAIILVYVFKVTFSTFLVLSFFIGFSMKPVLDQIRCLQMIVHLMMIHIILAESCLLFFAKIIELVIFDIIPTEYIYPLIFFFKNDSAYTEEAEALGYGSRYLIINTGSVTIFIIANVFLHLFSWCLVKICR